MNSHDAGATGAKLDAMRDQGLDRHDPVRFQFMQALARRATAHQGGARVILDQRLSALIASYEQDIQCAAANRDHPVANDGGALAQDPLYGLNTYIASHSRPDRATSEQVVYPELAAIDYFRKIWANLHTRQQLRQSLAQVHGNAGPLNSDHLVHRALLLMRDTCPGYLHHFLAHVDALSWMEQLNRSTTGKDAPVTKNAKKGARSASSASKGPTTRS